VGALPQNAAVEEIGFPHPPRYGALPSAIAEASLGVLIKERPQTAAYAPPGKRER
jgi:hypothetical protein